MKAINKKYDKKNEIKIDKPNNYNYLSNYDELYNFFIILIY